MEWKKYYTFPRASALIIHSQWDIPALMYEAKYPENFSLVNLGAWNDHPLTMQAIMERVVAEINSF